MDASTMQPQRLDSDVGIWAAGECVTHTMQYSTMLGTAAPYRRLSGNPAPD